MISDYLKKIFNKDYLEGLILAFLASVFIVPQVVQQIFQDFLPSTGDPVHKRMVYFMTNFPNFYNEVMMSETGHSKLFHYGLSLLNIVAGFVETKSFYGFVAVSLMALVSILITILMIAKRLGIKYSFVNLLFFLSSPILVFPFLGQANQYLIYLFLPLVVFVIFFIPPKFRTHCALALLIGATLNSHFMIWLPLLFFAFSFEWFYPQFQTLIFLPIGVLLYWPFLGPPLLALTAGLSAPLVMGAMLIGIFVLLLFHQLIKRKNKLSRICIWLTAGTALFLFIYPQEYGESLPKNLYDAVTSFENVGFFAYFFGLGKSWTGDQFYGVLFTIISPLVLWMWINNKIKIPPLVQTRLKMLALLALIPAGIAILKFILLSLNPFYFIASRLAQLHQLRLTVLAFFFLPFLLTYFLQYWHSRWHKLATVALSVILIINIASISHFFYLRTFQNLKQIEYFESLDIAILEFSAYEYELEYLCYFKGECDKTLQPLEGTTAAETTDQ